MRAAIRAIEFLTGSVGLAAAVLVAPLVVASCYEVFARYIFGAPTIWAFELGYMMMGAHFMLGAAYTLKKGAHIRIDLIYAHLRRKKRAWVDLIGYVGLLLPFLAVLTWYLWDYAYTALQTGEQTGQSAWSPVIWPFRMVYVAAFGLLALQVIAEAMKCIGVILDRPFIEEEG
jgi:TRAP-type mannitol/chloroaromatic compound transport system permease small subunit